MYCHVIMTFFHMRHFATGTMKSMSCALRCLVPLLAQSPMSRGFSCLVALAALATEGSCCSRFSCFWFLHSDSACFHHWTRNVAFCVYQTIVTIETKTNRYSRKKHGVARFVFSVARFGQFMPTPLPVLVCYLESFQDLRGCLRLKETNSELSSQFLWTIYWAMAI